MQSKCIVHTRHRNRLHPDKGRKQVLIKTDTTAEYGTLPRRERKFGAIGLDDLDGPSDGSNSASDDTEAEHSNLGDSLNSTIVDAQSEFTVLAQELVDTAEEIPQVGGSHSANNAGGAEPSCQGNTLLLKHLFIYPQPSDLPNHSLAALMDVWQIGEQGWETELSYHEMLHTPD